jgi:ribosomal protein S18 acetylase RimI-like enzyme
MASESPRAEIAELVAATRDDARDIARLTEMAGEGLPAVLWARSAGPGQTALDIGTARAARDSGDFSWRNCTLARVEGRVAAALLGYRIPAEPVPLDDLPAEFRGLQELENLVPGAWYVNVLATYPEMRRRGLGRALLDHAERLAGGSEMAIIVASANAPAIALYASQGYRERARRPLVRPDGWSTDSTHFVLLVKPAA